MGNLGIVWMVLTLSVAVGISWRFRGYLLIKSIFKLKLFKRNGFGPYKEILTFYSFQNVTTKMSRKKFKINSLRSLLF